LSVPNSPHLPRHLFIGLLKRIRGLPGAMLVGNSSAGLIEAAAIGIPVVNVGRRQAGRERAPHAIDVPEPTEAALQRAIRRDEGRPDVPPLATAALAAHRPPPRLD
jgi:hypothetical protein